MSDYAEVLQRLSLEAVSVMGGLQADKVRIVAEVRGMRVEIAIDDWSKEEDE